MTPSTREKIEKEFDERFGFDEIYVCKNCGHSKESHYWNGGGCIQNSGYDACLVKECGCSCLSIECDIKKIPTNQEFKSFIFSTIDSILAEKAEEIKNEKKAVRDRFIGHDTDRAYGPGRDEGFNYGLECAQDILKKQ